MGTVCVIATALVACGSWVLLRVTKCWACVYLSEYECSVCDCNGSGSMWFVSVIACDEAYIVCLPEWVRVQCMWLQRLPECLCNVVILPMETASIRRRHRTRDHGKRNAAQTVSLEPKQCRAEPLAFEGPSAGGWGWVLAANRVRHSIYLVSPAPGCPWYSSAVSGNSVFDSVPAVTQDFG
jgi:hypothetical protein